MLTWLRDAAGMRVPRVVAPLFDSMTWRLPETEGPAAALTFDDGPTGATPELLDALAASDARATFFLLGENVERRPDMAAAVVAAGHEVANHSWSHVNAWRTPTRATVREFARTDVLLTEVAGRPVRWVRPPYGKFTYPLIHWARRRGQRVALWDTMPCDYSPRASVQRVVRGLSMTRPGSIVCLHDNARSAAVTPAALREVLPRLRDEGYRFPTLSEAFAGETGD